MATKTEDRPGVSKYDKQPEKVYTDYALNKVSPDSDAAAFSWLPADLTRAKERREELGLNDDQARAQAESRKAELAAAKRRLAVEQARVDALEAEVSSEKAEPKSQAKAAKEEK